MTVSGGTLGGAITDRDVTIQSRLDALNSLAANVASAVNALHETGYGSNGATGLDFFTGNHGKLHCRELLDRVRSYERRGVGECQRAQ